VDFIPFLSGKAFCGLGGDLELEHPPRKEPRRASGLNARGVRTMMGEEIPLAGCNRVPEGGRPQSGQQHRDRGDYEPKKIPPARKGLKYEDLSEENEWIRQQGDEICSPRARR
jgi:hypothetical protein